MFWIGFVVGLLIGWVTLLIAFVFWAESMRQKRIRAEFLKQRESV